MAYNKYYVSLNKLSVFLDNLKKTFATLGHKHQLADITDFSVDSSVVSSKVITYKNPTSIPIASGTQVICYCSQGGVFEFSFGDKTFTYESTSSDDAGWFLWVQTADDAGSVILPNGTRTYMITGGTVSTVDINYTTTNTVSNYIIITIGYAG